MFYLLVFQNSSSCLHVPFWCKCIPQSFIQRIKWWWIKKGSRSGHCFVGNPGGGGGAGWVRGQNVSAPKIGLRFPAPLINFIFCPRKFFDVGVQVGRPGLARAPNNPPTPTPSGVTKQWPGPVSSAGNGGVGEAELQGILEGVARTVQRFDICVFIGTVSPPRFQAQRHKADNAPARQKETPGIIQKPLATIHKHLGWFAVGLFTG